MKVFQSLFKGFKGLRHLSLVLGLITVLLPFVAEAGQGFKHGVVMSRAVVLDEETQQPILVEFAEDGTEAGLVSVPAQYRNAIESLKIISASEYRFHEGRLEQYLQLHANDLALGAEVMDRAQFESSVFKAADNTTPVTQSELGDNVKSILVRGQSNRIIANGDELALLTFPVNLAQAAIVNDDDRSIVLTEDGDVIATSTNNIAYRVGFYGDANEAQDPSGSYNRDQANDTVFGPVAGVKVSVSEEAYPGGIAFTDEAGKYAFTYYLPTCPLGGFEFTTDVYAELKYQNFRPIGSPAIPYYLRRQDWDYCYASFQGPSANGLSVDMGAGYTSSYNTNYYPIDMTVDVMFLTGLVKFQNPGNSAPPIPVIDKTEYGAFATPADKVAQTQYDFNGDNIFDTPILGIIKTVTDENGDTSEQFVAESAFIGGEVANVQGIYFNAADVAEAQPDLIRIIDDETRLEDTGFLKSISREDYQNTDVLVFRESTGQLVVERIGLRDEEIDHRDSAKYYDETQTFIYRIMLRGVRDSSINIGGAKRVSDFTEFASNLKMTEPFRVRDADHLKPGERVRIVAINRATGYIGTETVQLSGAANNPASFLNISVDEIVMRPPNLKVWAERDYEVSKGLTQGEDRHYTIGAEGAGLTSDTTVTIYTEWLDHDGSALPEGFGIDNGEQYGYTGRLAKIVSPGVLQAAAVTAYDENGSGSDLAEFPISPGRHIQAVNIASNLSSAEHYYVHVSGTPIDASPDFATGESIGAAPPYEKRPAKLTPFKVPLFNEDSHWLKYNAYRQLEKAFDSSDPNAIDPTKPLPAYAWQYRPEYQFSQFELEVQELNKVQNPGETDEEKENILDLATPGIASSDDLIEMLYSLISSDFDRLTPIDGPQELILALGEDEQLITLGEDKTITFDNIEHLGSLDPEDFLTMRLYTNNDAGNVLWEYAFEYVRTLELYRTVRVGTFNSDVNNSGLSTITDSYRDIPVRIKSDSIINIQLLDAQKNVVKQILQNQSITADDYHFFVTYEDIGSELQPIPGIDFHLKINVTDSETGQVNSQLYEGHLRHQTSNEMLGQVLQHDVLIQRGSLSLRREDMGLKGVGPQLNFVRSYTNVNKVNNKSDERENHMGQGWSHNHNISVSVISEGEEQDRFANNLPEWLKITRDTSDKPILIADAALIDQSIIPLMVQVSNGGLFYYQGGQWHAQRGNHGRLQTIVVGDKTHFEYRSKDGTDYIFEPIDENTKRGQISAINDRNGNSLSYDYVEFHGKDVLSTITDATGRQLFFNYEQIEGGYSRIFSVESSDTVGIDLEFSYYQSDSQDIDSIALQGALKQFKRDDFTEEYLYELNGDDDVVNMVSAIDAIGQTTAYEYYESNQVPTQLNNYVKGLQLSDVVKEVVYPGNKTATFVYDVASANKRIINDLRSNDTTYTLNDFGNPIRLDEPHGKVTTMTWSIDLAEDDNVLRSRVDEFGATTEYEYDSKGNLTLEKDPYGNTITQVWDQNYGVLLSRIDQNGYKSTRTIDANGNVTDEYQDATINGTVAQVHIKHSYYSTANKAGLRQKTIDGKNNTTTFDYDSYGLLASIVEPEGSETKFVNDARGRTLSKRDARNNSWSYTYDNLDRLDISTDPASNTIDSDYDAKGNKVKETHKDTYVAAGTSYTRNLSLTYEYDERDRVKKVTRNGQTTGLSGSNVAGEKTYTYDENSNLTSESDWNGVASTHAYDDLNRIKSTQNRLGDSMAYQYAFVADSGLKKTTTDYEGRISIENFDLLGRLTKLDLPSVDSSNYSRSYEYDNINHLTKETDENNHSTEYAYDGRYLKTNRTNALGKQFLWRYDQNGNLIGATDENGRETTQEFDKQNRLTLKVEPENHKWQYAYDDNGNQTSVIDPYGFQHKTEYDNVNQPNKVITPDGDEVVAFTHDGKKVYHKDAEGRETYQLYSVDSRLISSSDAVGRTTTQVYDNNGNVTSVSLDWGSAATGPNSVSTINSYDAVDRLKTTTESGRVTSFDYDKVGNLLVQTQPDNRITKYVYDALNRVTTIEDALNNTAKKEYDGVGNVTLVENRLGKQTKTTYDELNRPLVVTDALSQTMSFSYDNVGNLLSETDKRGTETTHTYDNLDRLVATHKRAVSGQSAIRLVLNEYDAGMPNGHKQSTVDANNNRIVNTFNWRGQVTLTELPLGSGYSASTIQSSYDGSGFKISQADEQNFTTLYAYFDDGSINTVTNAELEVTSFEYDLFGNQAKVTNPKGYSSSSTYDDLNRLVSIADALMNETRFEYDDNDNLIHQYMPGTDSAESHVEYQYDLLNRRLKHIQHKSGGNLVVGYDYDDEGNVTSVTDAKSQSFAKAYDDLNRLTQQDYPSGSDLERVVTTYDANNNVNTITETKIGGITEVTDHNYDLLDRVTQTTQRGHTISYGYDNNGNRTLVSSNGGSTSYTYDSRNRLATAVANSEATSYSYFANNWKERVLYANGTEALYTYDQVGRVDTITNQKTSDLTLISSFDYDYDDNGNRIEQIEIQNGFAASKQQTTSYSYDDLDRMEGYTILDNETGDVAETVYSFFPSYDRETETVTETVSSVSTVTTNRRYSYDETYWLTDVTDQDTSNAIAYSYDFNGNTLTKLDNIKVTPESTAFNYNSRDQLVKVTRGPPGGELDQGTYDYNYAGMRIRHLGSERGDIEYIYDGQSILEEVQNNTNSLVAHYRYADRLISLTTPSDTQFYHFATLGTTANLSDDSGNVAKSYRTDPYGEITQQEGSSVNRQVFTGQEHDEQTGLIYFGARYYDPDSARFITQDSYLGESGTPPSLHRYLYAYGNPTVWVDPTGNFNVGGDPASSAAAKEATKQIVGKIAVTSTAEAIGSGVSRFIPGVGWVVTGAVIAHEYNEMQKQFEADYSKARPQAIELSEFELPSEKLSREKLLQRTHENAPGQLLNNQEYFNEVSKAQNRELTAESSDGVSSAKRKISDPPGTKRNSAGRLVDVNTGKFVKDPNSAASKGELTPVQMLRYDQQPNFNKNSKEVIDKDISCPYCQKNKQEATDHILSVQRAQQAVEGGKISRDEALELLPSQENLTGACTSCNSSKGGHPLATDPSNVQPGQWPAPNPTPEILERGRVLEDKLE